eukprot:PhF_6_TR4047/c0_g1_i1/m.5543
MYNFFVKACVTLLVGILLSSHTIDAAPVSNVTNNTTISNITTTSEKSEDAGTFARDVILGIIVGVGVPIVGVTLYVWIRLKTIATTNPEEEFAPPQPLPKSELTEEEQIRDQTPRPPATTTN